MATGNIAPELAGALKTVLDPEVGVDIVELGLVYGARVEGDTAYVRMTMTSQACPLYGLLEAEVQTAVREHLPQIKDVQVELVWDPPWEPTMMSDQARRKLGWAGD